MFTTENNMAKSACKNTRNKILRNLKKSMFYVNDLPNKLKTTNSMLFADDTSIILSGKFSAFQDEISTELQVFDDWCLSN